MSNTLTQRGEILDKFLREINAVGLTQTSVPTYNNGRAYFDLMTANGKEFIVHSMHQEGRCVSWNIFIPAHPGNKVDSTFEAVKEYLKSK